MARLRKLTLQRNRSRGRWDLIRSHRIVRSFRTKADATAAGVLTEAAGGRAASIRIRKRNGQYQEERTVPRSKDPKGRKG